jgi:hypothetical protein
MTGLMALAITGRRLTPAQCSVLDDAAVVLTLADPRIWPLKLTRLVAAYGRPLPAMVAGVLCLEQAQVGSWPTANAAVMLAGFHSVLRDRLTDADAVRTAVGSYLEQHRFMWGFGVPFRPKDERVVAFRECIRRRGRHELPHWRTMESIVGAVHTLRKVEPNIGLAIAAASLDVGLDPAEIGPMLTMLLQHTFLANAVEGASQAPEVLRLLPLDYVRFTGRAPRTSPRALAAASPAR